MSLIIKAANFALRAHGEQKRKDGVTPYILHPARVASRVALLKTATEEMVAAAYLHDVLEDTNVSEAELGAQFGPVVLALVKELTNPSKGVKAPRAERKRMDREHAAHASTAAKQIKMLDRIDNLTDMVALCEAVRTKYHDEQVDFAKLYAQESQLLVDAIGDADGELAAELRGMINRIR